MNIDYKQLIGSLSRGLGGELVNYVTHENGLTLYMRHNLSKDSGRLIAAYIRSYLSTEHGITPRIRVQKTRLEIHLPD